MVVALTLTAGVSPCSRRPPDYQHVTVSRIAVTSRHLVPSAAASSEATCATAAVRDGATGGGLASTLTRPGSTDDLSDSFRTITAVTDTSWTAGRRNGDTDGTERSSSSAH